MQWTGTRGSSVIPLTRLWAGQPRNRGLIPGRDQRFVSSPNRPGRLWDLLSLLFNDWWRSTRTVTVLCIPNVDVSCQMVSNMRSFYNVAQCCLICTAIESMEELPVSNLQGYSSPRRFSSLWACYSTVLLVRVCFFRRFWRLFIATIFWSVCSNSQ